MNEREAQVIAQRALRAYAETLAKAAERIDATNDYDRGRRDALRVAAEHLDSAPAPPFSGAPRCLVTTGEA